MPCSSTSRLQKRALFWAPCCTASASSRVSLTCCCFPPTLQHSRGGRAVLFLIGFGLITYCLFAWLNAYPARVFPTPLPSEVRRSFWKPLSQRPPWPPLSCRTASSLSACPVAGHCGSTDAPEVWPEVWHFQVATSDCASRHGSMSLPAACLRGQSCLHAEHRCGCEHAGIHTGAETVSVILSCLRRRWQQWSRPARRRPRPRRQRRKKLRCGFCVLFTTEHPRRTGDFPTCQPL